MWWEKDEKKITEKCNHLSTNGYKNTDCDIWTQHLNLNERRHNILPETPILRVLKHLASVSPSSSSSSRLASFSLVEGSFVHTYKVNNFRRGKLRLSHQQEARRSNPGWTLWLQDPWSHFPVQNIRWKMKFFITLQQLIGPHKKLRKTKKIHAGAT